MSWASAIPPAATDLQDAAAQGQIQQQTQQRNLDHLLVEVSPLDIGKGPVAGATLPDWNSGGHGLVS